MQPSNESGEASSAIKTHREPLRQELRIKKPTWSGLDDDTKKTRARESNGNKEKIIAPFMADPKCSAPVTKNRNLRTI